MKIHNVLFVCALALNLAAAQQANQDVPKITSRTSLVLVPVVVTRDGQHVSGLTKADFQVLEDGTAQKIASFEEVKAADIRAQSQKPQAGIYSNATTASDQPQRVTV